MTTTPRTFEQMLADLRTAIGTLIGLPAGLVRPGNQAGVPVPQVGNWATVLATTAHNRGTPAQTVVDAEPTTIDLESTFFREFTADIQIFRAGAFELACLLDHALQADFGAHTLRSVAIAYNGSTAINMTSAVVSTLWEERALVRASFSAMFTLTDRVSFLDPAMANATLGGIS